MTDSPIRTSPLLQETVFRFGNTHRPISSHRSPSERSFFGLLVSACRLNSFSHIENSKFKSHFLHCDKDGSAAPEVPRRFLQKVSSGLTRAPLQPTDPNQSLRKRGCSWGGGPRQRQKCQANVRATFGINTSAYSRTLQSFY